MSAAVCAASAVTGGCIQADQPLLTALLRSPKSSTAASAAPLASQGTAPRRPTRGSGAGSASGLMPPPLPPLLLLPAAAASAAAAPPKRDSSAACALERAPMRPPLRLPSCRAQQEAGQAARAM